MSEFDPHALYRRYAENQMAEEAAWRPQASSMEALVLKVLGGWQTLVSDVNWAHFHSVGPGGPPVKKGQSLPATIRKVAVTYNVRWPHDDWSATCDQVGKVRHKLAHLLYVHKVDNDSPPPNRKLAFMRLGEPGRPRLVDGHPAELSHRDEVWSQQTRHIDIVTESELADALRGIKWLVDCVHFLERLGDCLNRDDPWSDDYMLPEWERELLVWWFPEWGDFRTATVTAGQLRLTPRHGTGSQ